MDVGVLKSHFPKSLIEHSIFLLLTSNSLRHLPKQTDGRTARIMTHSSYKSCLGVAFGV